MVAVGILLVAVVLGFLSRALRVGDHVDLVIWLRKGALGWIQRHDRAGSEVDVVVRDLFDRSSGAMGLNPDLVKIVLTCRVRLASAVRQLDLSGADGLADLVGDEQRCLAVLGVAQVLADGLFDDGAAGVRDVAVERLAWRVLAWSDGSRDSAGGLEPDVRSSADDLRGDGFKQARSRTLKPAVPRGSGRRESAEQLNPAGAAAVSGWVISLQLWISHGE